MRVNFLETQLFPRRADVTQARMSHGALSATASNARIAREYKNSRREIRRPDMHLGAVGMRAFCSLGYFRRACFSLLLLLLLQWLYEVRGTGLAWTVSASCRPGGGGTLCNASHLFS